MSEPTPTGPQPPFAPRGGPCPCARCRMRGLMGPVMVLTTGVLFLIPKLIPQVGFRDLWPVFLIVIGLIMLLQSTASTEGHRG